MAEPTFLAAAKKEFSSQKNLGEKAMAQLAPEQFFLKHLEKSNSIAIIVQHMSGNMLSRWTNFLTTDGEKEWRQRDTEFEIILDTKEQVMDAWNRGWDCLMDALNSLNNHQLEDMVLIRAEPHTVTQAILRQLAHYSNHVGQIVILAKILKGEKFESLSIPHNESAAFNAKMFGKSGR